MEADTRNGVHRTIEFVSHRADLTAREYDSLFVDASKWRIVWDLGRDEIGELGGIVGQCAILQLPCFHYATATAGRAETEKNPHLIRLVRDRQSKNPRGC